MHEEERVEGRYKKLYIVGESICCNEIYSCCCLILSKQSMQWERPIRE